MRTNGTATPYPQVRVIPPGGPYFKWPWETVHKVSIATQTLNMAYDPEDPDGQQGRHDSGSGHQGPAQHRADRPDPLPRRERNLYAYLFGVKRPIVHVMGYFVSVLRERIANFEARAQATAGRGPPPDATARSGHLDQRPAQEPARPERAHGPRVPSSSAARYGIMLDASLITGIDPPPEVESALAAINTAHNQVSSEISLAQAGADQKIVQSRRAVEIETLKAQAEVEPLKALAAQLTALKKSGPER